MKHDILSNMSVGDRCVIDAIHTRPSERKRLEDLGFSEGNAIQCAHIASSGSPIAFWVKGALIALRRADCENITVRNCAD